MKKFLNWIESKLEFIWHKAEKSANNDLKSLGIIRIFYGLFVLLLIRLDFAWIGQAPQGLFLPRFLSFSNFFQGFPNYSIMRSLEMILIFLGLCILLGIRARWTGIIFAIVYIIANSFHFSFGKINHGSIMLITFILGLSFTNWGVNYALISDPKVSKNSQQKILAILAIILCFAMFTAGFEKALYWLDFDFKTGGFLSWFYQGYFTQGRNDFLAPLILQLPPTTFEIADYSAVVFELSPLFALLAGRKWWWGWLLIACIFHLVNILLLNINFIGNAPVYLTFISFPWITLASQKKEDLIIPKKLKIFLLTTTFVIVLHYLFIFVSGQPINSPLLYLIDSQTDSDLGKLYLSLVLWTMEILVIGYSLFSLITKKNNLKTIR